MKLARRQARYHPAVAARRKYDSLARAEGSRATRRRILEVSRDLFLAGGYLGTTLDGIATRAGVSAQTVYNLVGGKAAVFKAVYDVTLAGDDEPVPLVDRPIFQKVTRADSPRAALAAYAEVGQVLWQRVGPLVRVATAQAAAGDRELRAFVATIEAERSAGVRGLVEHLAGRFGLRPGLSAERAADIVWVLAAPEMIDRLVVDRGWTWDDYRTWVAETAAHALFA
jgi:AcrR family transcriptional regulator